MSRPRNLKDYAVILNQKDNVATALVDLPAGDYILGSGQSETAVTVPEDIRAGFKLALSDIGRSQPVYKYGYAIGHAVVDIKKGDCVHIHNLISSV